MKDKTTFSFLGYTNRLKQGSVTFNFELERDGRSIRFEEKLSIDSSIKKQSKFYDSQPIRLILDNILLVLGISYWKLYCPTEIRIHPFSLTKRQAEFWNTLYTKGMGEFYYKNNINFKGLVCFPHDTRVTNAVRKEQVNDKRILPWSLVQIGGGKDSIVTTELLKRDNKKIQLVVLNPCSIHRRIAQIAGIPLLAVSRELDDKLFTLNSDKNTYNGHIPISAIYAFVDLLVAELCGASYIIASNEKSANYGNISYLGQEINHQWSKSLEFENLFRDYLRAFISPHVEYFSLLRPLYEIKIVELFSHHKDYFGSFSSCNTNFSYSRPAKALWCGRCPKCAFVFLLLSVFLPLHEVVAIFKKNLLADASLIGLYRRILGMEGFKPFECVGTPEEAQYALKSVSGKSDYTNLPLVKELWRELKGTKGIIDFGRNELFAVSGKHHVPSAFDDVLHMP